MTRAEIARKFAAARAAGRTGERVLTDQGQYEHVQGTWTHTMCGREISRERTENARQEDESFFQCMKCERSNRKRF